MRVASSLLRYCRNPSHILPNAGNTGAHLYAFSTRAHDAPGGDATDNALSNDLLSTTYCQLLGRGVLLPDATQVAAVHALQLLQNAVLQYEKLRSSSSGEGNARGEFRPRPEGGVSDSSSSSSSSSSSGVVVSSDSNNRQVGDIKIPATAGGGEIPVVQIAPKPRTIRGAYLWGPVGSGKTAMMDIFASTTQRCLEAAAAATAVHPPHLDSAVTPAAAAAAAAAGTAAPHLLLRSCERHHFHEFMQSVHGRLHELHKALPRVVARSREGRMVYRYAEPDEDPLVTVARELGSRTAVLCLDELHVTDVADAMILARLFAVLLVDFDTKVVFTSNRPAKDLYKGGLSRKYFEPFVQLVDEQMVVLRVAAGVDYRKMAGVTVKAAKAETRKVEAGVVRVGNGCSTTPDAEREVDESALRKGRGDYWYFGFGASKRLHSQWRQRAAAAAAAQSARKTDGAASGDGGGSGPLDPQLGDVGVPVTVPLAYGRTLKVPCASGDAALFTFEQLCGANGLRAAVDQGGALAAPDFLALCRRFREIFITGVPQLGPADRDEARRFVTLLDVAYDNRCQLSVAAAVPPDTLFAPLLDEARRQGVNPRLGLAKTTFIAHHQVGPMAGGGPEAAAAPEEDPTAASAAANENHDDNKSLPPPSSWSSSLSSSSPSRQSVSARIVGDDEPSAFLPAANVTAALHSRLGPSMTHGSASTNTIHANEFTGSSISTPFDMLKPVPLSPPPSPSPVTTTTRTGGTHPLTTDYQGGNGSGLEQQQQQKWRRKQARMTPTQPGDLTLPRALLGEEVLMYHRATSRLAEMCQQVIRVE